MQADKDFYKGAPSIGSRRTYTQSAYYDATGCFCRIGIDLKR
jgi:hypothetical protein